MRQSFLLLVCSLHLSDAPRNAPRRAHGLDRQVGDTYSCVQCGPAREELSLGRFHRRAVRGQGQWLRDGDPSRCRRQRYRRARLQCLCRQREQADHAGCRRARGHQPAHCHRDGTVTRDGCGYPAASACRVHGSGRGLPVDIRRRCHAADPCRRPHFQQWRDRAGRSGDARNILAMDTGLRPIAPKSNTTPNLRRRRQSVNKGGTRRGPEQRLAPHASPHT